MAPSHYGSSWQPKGSASLIFKLDLVQGVDSLVGPKVPLQLRPRPFWPFGPPHHTKPGTAPRCRPRGGSPAPRKSDVAPSEKGGIVIPSPTRQNGNPVWTLKAAPQKLVLSHFCGEKGGTSLPDCQLRASKSREQNSSTAPKTYGGNQTGRPSCRWIGMRIVCCTCCVCCLCYLCCVR